MNHDRGRGETPGGRLKGSTELRCSTFALRAEVQRSNGTASLLQIGEAWTRLPAERPRIREGGIVMKRGEAAGARPERTRPQRWRGGGRRGGTPNLSKAGLQLLGKQLFFLGPNDTRESEKTSPRESKGK